MKKSLISILLLIFMISIAGSAFAVVTSNPFEYLPAEHWSYGAVKKLAAADIIEGYNGELNNGKVTRYEMAIFVAKAIAQENKADAEQKELIKKLMTEFIAELQTIGVRFSEAKEPSDISTKSNMTSWGYIGFRYDWQKDSRIKKQGAFFDITNVVHLRDGSTISVQSVANKNTLISSNRIDDNDVNGDFNKFARSVYLDTKVGNSNVKIGSFKFDPGYGMVVSGEGTNGSNSKGIKVDFGSQKVRTTLFTGRTGGLYGTFADINDSSYHLAEIDYALAKDTMIKAAYHKVPNQHFYEVGFDQKVGAELVLTGAMAQTNKDVDKDTGYMAQLSYNNLNFVEFMNKLHSYKLFTAYRYMPSEATINGGCNGSDFYGDYYDDFKGWSVGGQYVIKPMVVLTTFYEKGKSVSNHTDKDLYRAQLDFFF